MIRRCPVNELRCWPKKNQILPSERVADLSVLLPRPLINEEWPQQGGYANHAMHHLAIGDVPSELWSASTGTALMTMHRSSRDRSSPRVWCFPWIPMRK